MHICHFDLEVSDSNVNNYSTEYTDEMFVGTLVFTTVAMQKSFPLFPLPTFQFGESCFKRVEHKASVYAHSDLLS